jgi:hypothetical protein
MQKISEETYTSRKRLMELTKAETMEETHTHNSRKPPRKTRMGVSENKDGCQCRAVSEEWRQLRVWCV